MGPFALMDLVGLDVNLAVSTSVYEQTYHDPRFAPNVIQQALVDAGRLGRKSGAGFYEYGDNVVAPAPNLHPEINWSGAIAEVGHAGDLGHAAGLLGRLSAAGIAVEPASAPLPGLVVGDALLWPTDGRAATAVSADPATGGVVALDLVGDWSAATTVAIAPAAQTGAHAVAQAAALLQAAGLDVVVVGDGPGVLLMRIVAQLTSVAADAVQVGVATANDVDVAMKLGTNYPEGPIAWADKLGAATLVTVLDNLQTFYGEDRYRPSTRLRRAGLTGSTLGAGGTE